MYKGNKNWSQVLKYASIPSMKQVSIPRSRFSHAKNTVSINVGCIRWEEDGTIDCNNDCIEDQAIDSSSCNC